MAAGSTFLANVVGAHAAPIVNSVIVAGTIGITGYAARRSLARGNRLVPDDSFSLRTVYEVLAQMMVSLGDTAMGKQNRRFLPFVTALFVYLLLMNLFGLVPGFVLSTDHYQINVGIALVAFAMYNVWGVREMGVLTYLKHFWGPIWWFGFMLFPIELVSHAIRPLTLSLRLFGNMTGDHNLLSAMNDLVAGPFTFWAALPFYFLGTLVCFVQALVFTLLTMVYIRLAVAHH